MKMDVIINRKAGNTAQLDLVSRLSRFMGHADLEFHEPASVGETSQVIDFALRRGSKSLVVCGGDGTLNTVLNLALERVESKEEIPPVCVIPTGTANDLAYELGISKKIEEAARAAYEGKIRNVDLLEVQSEQGRSYVLTCGGMGVPASTADHANRAKDWSKKDSPCSLPRMLHPLSWAGKRMVRGMGSKIYEAILLKELLRWDEEDWGVSVEAEGLERVTTQAPMILVNNQKSIGGRFYPAPETQNNDGRFNVFLFNSDRLLSQVKDILNIRKGRIPDLCSSFETDRVTFRANESSRPFTFFGDGEVIHRDVRWVDVRCVHPGLPVLQLSQ